jgi:hypothetical protein
MAVPPGNTSLIRLKNRYRLVLLNEDTFEEVAAFKMNRVSVYFTIATLFIVLVGLTLALIMFTPLKMYIPGYGEAEKSKEYQALQLKADSINMVLEKQQQYMNSIEKVLKGNVLPPDTTTLKIKPPGKRN